MKIPKFLIKKSNQRKFVEKTENKIYFFCSFTKLSAKCLNMKKTRVIKTKKIFKKKLYININLIADFLCM